MNSNVDRETATTTLETRHFQGVRAGVGLTPDEIFVDFPLPSPRYFRIRTGDHLVEGDVRRLTAAELESPRLRNWEIVGITPDRVVGLDRSDDGGGERTEWERSWVEEQLVRGGLSTDLTEFERVTVLRRGDRDDAAPGADDALGDDAPEADDALEEGAPGADDTLGGDAEPTPDGASSVLVVVFGNDGQKYLQEYAFVDPENDSDLRLERQDQALLELSADPRERLADAV
ncbi:hypothetical protein ACFQE1_17245, partial [Halobium palmae]